MSTNYDKPYKTYGEQLDHLCDEYGLTISNRDKAEISLSTLSYYDIINGYQEFFRCNNKYPSNVTFEYLCDFHKFDRNLQAVLFKYSTYVETSFKTTLAHVIAKDFGVDIPEYLDSNKYSRPSNSTRRKKLRDTLEELEKATNGANLQQPTKHYSSSKNHIPPWILFKNATFNSTIDLYTFLKNDQKTQIVKEMFKYNNLPINDSKELLKKSLTITRKFRNKIAHNLKFSSYKVPNTDQISSIHIKRLLSFGTQNRIYKNNDFRNNNRRGTDDIYAMVLCIYILLMKSELGNEFLIELKNLIEYNDKNTIYPDYARLTNLPSDLAERIALHLKTNQ